MNITQRFIASVGLFSLPLGVLFYFNMAQILPQIDFANHKLSGSRFQVPASGCLRLLQILELQVT